MTFLGIRLMWWTLLGSFGLAALLAIAWVAAMDRELARRTARASSIPVARSLPLGIGIPAAHRRKHRSRWS